MADTTINGTNLLVYVNATVVAGAKSCKLSLKHDARDCTTKECLGWEKKGTGKRSWTVTCDGLVMFDATNYGPDDLAGLITNRTEVTLKFSTETSQHGYWQGSGFLTGMDVDGGTEESVSYSASFDGSGACSYLTHT